MTDTISGGIVYVKAGGSFITFKDRLFSVNYDALEKLSEIIAKTHDSVRILLGNGGGSFAHPVVEEYRDKDPSRLLVYCQRYTRLLNKIVVDYLVDRGIPAVSCQTSTLIVEDLEGLDAWVKPVEILLDKGFIPVVYGECIASRRSIYRVLSTEDVFTLLSRHVNPDRIVLLMDVDGVYTCDPRRCGDAVLVKRIDPSNYDELVKRIGGSRGVDVTGGIRGKVEKMMSISRSLGIPVIMVSGFNVDEAIKAILYGSVEKGTIIRGY